MKTKPRLDANHLMIVTTLRRLGVKVQSLAAIGRGCPDLLCSFQGRTFVVEVKDGRKSPSERKLTPLEHDWISQWAGEVWVVETLEDCTRVLRGKGGRAR